ncbi:MAG: hypothetical protein CL946_13505 [Ectothiorhodospiraceae bacterium]|nr:hypothetical protein [Ectothiorhodospiraceae bacterium]
MSYQLKRIALSDVGNVPQYGADAAPRERAKRDAEQDRASQSEQTTERDSATEEVSDFDLLQEFQNGNEQAYVKLYQRRKLDIYRYALRLLSGDEDKASDAFQDAFMRVYENANSFTHGTNVRGWMMMITRNICLNMIRDSKKNAAIDDFDTIPGKDRNLDPEVIGERKSIREALDAAISGLPEDLREAIVLREFEGLPYNEISKMSGASPGTIRQRIWRAKQRIRKELWPYFKDDFPQQEPES